MARLIVEWDSLPPLTVPARVMLFGNVRKGKRKTVGVAWQGWNPDPRMEERMARLKGSGSFYWAAGYLAVRWARQQVEAGTAIQAKVETISGREIARVYLD